MEYKEIIYVSIKNGLILRNILSFHNLFYCVLEDYNIRIDRARECIIKALHEWMKPELDKAITKEKASGNPFKGFVYVYCGN